MSARTLNQQNTIENDMLIEDRIITCTESIKCKIRKNEKPQKA